MKRKPVSHVAVAAAAKAAPGTWVRVGAYQARYVAQSMASAIRAGGRRMTAYAPAGTFETRIKDREFDTEVYVRVPVERGERP